MELSKIEDLWNKHNEYVPCGCDTEDGEVTCDCEPEFTMSFTGLVATVNQMELEWYKELEKKLDGIKYIADLSIFKNEIQNKITQLEMLN